jgi:hypothetical protein
MTAFKVSVAPLTLVGGDLASFATSGGNFVSNIIVLNSYVN